MVVSCRVILNIAALIVAAWGFCFGNTCLAQEEAAGPPPELLSVDRYFPMDLNVVYTYKLSLIEKQVTVHLEGDYDESTSYEDDYYVFATRSNPLGEGTYFELIAEDDEDADSESGYVIDRGQLIGKLDDWCIENGAMDEPPILQTFPAELTQIGQEWAMAFASDFSNLPSLKATGTVAAIEDVSVLTGMYYRDDGTEGGVDYQDCLRLEYVLSIDEVFDEDWFTRAGDYLKAQATVTLWFAPDVGLVKGIARLDSIDTIWGWFLAQRFLAGEDVAILELVTRIPMAVE